MDGISGDGLTVVGSRFRWTSAGGMIEMTGLAHDASYDGSMIATGGCTLWTESSSTFYLGDLPGGLDSCIAWAVSDDGGVVAGGSSSAAYPSSTGEGFRWTLSDGMVGLGSLPGSTYGSTMNGISGNGEVLVGFSSDGTMQAVKWTETGGMANLGTLPSGAGSRAVDASYDGSVIVGWSGHAFRWEDGVMQDLGVLPGFSDSSANGVTADGSVVVGFSNEVGGDCTSWIWDATHGMRDLYAVLANEQGLASSLAGWDLCSMPGFFSIAISADGRAIAGTGRNPLGLREAWIVNLAATDPGAPSVDAGPHSTIAINAVAMLDGTVTDNNGGDAPTVLWTVVSGPGTVAFADATAADTTATFGAIGVYELRLTATDGSLSGFDAVYVTVNPLSVELTATADTYISNNKKDATKNFGAETTLRADGNPDQSALLRWDLSGIPAGSTIQSATLTLNFTGTGGDTYEVYELLRNWSETQTAWNKATSTTNWQSAGAQGAADRGTIVLGTISAPTTGERTIVLNADGIAAVQRWVNTPSTNNGLAIQDYANATNDDLIVSSREAAAANRPKLTVVYSPPPAAPSSVVVSAGSRVAGGAALAQNLTAVAELPRVERALARPRVDTYRMTTTPSAASHAATVDQAILRLTATRQRRLPALVAVDFE